MTTTTIQQLYDFARKHNLADAPLRVCDGMAVSYYPSRQSIVRGCYEIVIDISNDEPIEYDDLAYKSRINYDDHA